jgi:hypothetical protein
MLSHPLFPQIRVDCSDRPSPAELIVRVKRQIRRKKLSSTVENQWLVEAWAHDYEYMMRVTREYFTVIEKGVDI